MVLLGLVIFTSSVWMRETMQTGLEQVTDPIHDNYTQSHTDGPASKAYLDAQLKTVNDTILVSTFIQCGMIVAALLILFEIYSQIQKRERLIEVEKVLAEESSRAKTSFLSNMSHEIRTPMNAIIGLDNIILRNPNLDSKTREQVEKIGASAKHLLSLINDILDMSRIESGRMVLKDEEFSFRELLDQINIMINGQCVDKGLHYDCVIVGRVDEYYIGDDMKLKQVLINILGNSVKFTEPPGEVTLTIEQTAGFEEYRTLRFVMKDTGIGMDKEYIPKIFEAFSQEDSTTTNKYGGSGLGMAITKNFVEMMNGEIHVDSEKGVGTVFTVTVTLKASKRSVHDQYEITLPADLSTIVVDDDEIACEHIEGVFASLGISPVITRNPKEALALMRQACSDGTPFRLLIADYKMPEMTGLELIRQIRAFDGNKTAAIILTSYNSEDFEDDAAAAGVDEIMTKPLFGDTLIRKIHNVFLRKEGTEFIARQPEEASAEQISGILAGRRVLMAEDVAQNAEILEDLLDLEDIASEHAVNGQIAVEMFAASAPGYYDAILMDVRMPVLDGLGATRAIRALERPDAKTIPIIAMTANVFDEDVERSLQAGMDAHLSKPVEPERMYETMARLIGGGRRAAVTCNIDGFSGQRPEAESGGKELWK